MSFLQEPTSLSAQWDTTEAELVTQEVRAAQPKRSMGSAEGHKTGVTQGLAGATRLCQHLLRWEERLGVCARVCAEGAQRGVQDSIPVVI